MRIYSPSQTVKFMECPATWLLYKQGWRPKYVKKNTLSAILGTAFHDAIAEYYRADRQADVEEIVEIARKSVKANLARYDELGFITSTYDQDLRAALPTKAASLTKKYLTHKKYSDPILREYPDMTWEEPELQLTEYGYCKIDLPVHPRVGITAPLDWKVKLRMDDRYKWRTLEEWAYSWQFMHYAWALGKHTGRPVQEFFVVWVSLEPGFRSEILDYYIDAELMQLWENSAEQVWNLMERVENNAMYPYHNFQWFSRFGKTEMTDAVLDHRMHTDLMKQDYIQLPQGVRL